MDTILHVLHIDDSPFDRQLVRDVLEQESGRFTVVSAASRDEFERRLAAEDYDLVLTDFNILGFEGLQVIDAVHKKCPDLPVIVVTGTGSEEIAAEAMKRGAADYIIKTTRHIRRLPMAIQAVMELKQLRDDRLQSEEALRIGEEQLRAFANALPDLALIIDEEGRYVRVLSTPEHLLYVSGERQRGKLVHEVLPPPIADQIMDALLRTIETGITQSVEYELEMPTGAAWFEARISLMTNATSEKRFAVYVVRNITDRKLAEQALKASQQVLEKRNQVLTALYEIGHALSATLNSEQIYWTIYREFAQRVFDAPHFTIVLYNEVTESISPHFAIADNQPADIELFTPIPLAQGPIHTAIHTRKTQLVDLTDTEPQRPTVALYVPLTSANHVIGVMVVQCDEADALHDVDLTLVETISNQCAAALANAQLYEQAQQEIRERQLAEIKLARERNLLRTLIDNVPDYIYVINRQGQFIASNAAHAAATDLVPAQLIGKTSLEVFRSHLNQILHADDVQVMLAGISLINEERLITDTSGHSQWMLTTKVPLYNESGNVIGLVGISRDISQRKLDEEALRASEEHLRAVVSGTPVILFAFDQNGVFTLLQGQGLERAGLKSALYIGKSIFELDHDVFPDIRGHFQVVLSGEESSFVYIVRDTIFDVRCFPLRSKAGEVSEVIGVASDITERLKAERLQIELEKEQEVIALKERFLATASHDFRTPLSIIKMSAGMVELYFDRITAEQRTAKLQQVRIQVDRMIQLLDDILIVSKANAGKLEFEPERVALRLFCEQIWDDFRNISQKTHTIDFVYDVKEDWVYFDANLVHYILVNLLSNAIKYSPKQGQIRFEVVRSGPDLVFRVSDNGIGIPELDQAKLFQPFHRAANTKGIEGTGLGLSIVKSYVEAHGGTITVKSEEGKGTTITVNIPLKCG